jgi:hypothetical protein
MHIGLIATLAIVIVLFIFLKNMLQNDDKNELDNNTENEDITKKDNEEEIEMEEIFYKEVRNGEKTYQLLNVYNQFDLMFVKSIFQSEQIPYNIESENVSRIRPGMQVGSFGNADIYILDKDYDDAIKIIEEYKQNKLDNYKEKQTIRKPLEVLFGSWTVPEASDINGIEIKYKNN